jgi:hypothetical protein
MQAIARKMLTPLVCGVLILDSSACGTAHNGKRAQATASATSPRQATSSQTAAQSTPTNKSASTTPIAGTSLPAGVVAQVSRHFITRQMLEHKIGVEAVLGYQLRPTRPVPRGLIPKPPDYRECIAYLAAVANAGSTRPAPDTAHLKAQCEREHQDLLPQILGRLIRYYWVEEEATKAGVEMTTRDTDRALHFQFPSESDLHRFLAFTGLQESDERLILREQLLPDKWQRAVLPAYERVRHIKPPESQQMVAEVETEVANLLEAMRRRWIPKTRCIPGYVLAICSEYRR